MYVPLLRLKSDLSQGGGLPVESRLWRRWGEKWGKVGRSNAVDSFKDGKMRGYVRSTSPPNPPPIPTRSGTWLESLIGAAQNRQDGSQSAGWKKWIGLFWGFENSILSSSGRMTVSSCRPLGLSEKFSLHWRPLLRRSNKLTVQYSIS